jgi:VWFA-related protein
MIVRLCYVVAMLTLAGVAAVGDAAPGSTRVSGPESDYFNRERVVRTRPSRDLKRIAEETGGGYFELTKSADLSPTFTRVAQELRSQYLPAFAPTALDGKTHKIEVRVSRAGTTVRARKSYVAARDTEKSGQSW